ncbi:MAG: hypothetical protein PVI26_02185 [Chitinispirillia bacterium]
MIPGIKKVLYITVYSVFCFVQTGSSQLYPETNSIISNELYQLAGSGDTLWVLSSKGVNYHLNIADSTMDWKGFRDLKGWFIAYGYGHTLIRLMENDEVYYKTGIPDRLWLFSMTTPKQPKYIELPFDTDNLNAEAYFQASDALFFQNSFWLSCMNGGLVKYNIANGNKSIFFPGIDSTGFNEQEFVKAFLADSSGFYSDSTFVFNVVQKDSSLLWVACKTALWTFDTKDTTWEKINDSLEGNRHIHKYLDININKKNDTTYIYTILSELNGSDTVTSFYKYNTLSKKWIRSASKESLNVDIVFGKEEYVYMIDYQDDNIKLFNDTTEQLDLAQPYLNIEIFENRIDKANVDILNFSKTDIHYSINGSDTIFAIATDQGLFYSTNEHYDERNNIPFKYIGRSVPLKSGLKQIYAVPGIINDTHREAVFAYNLSKEDRVTIDIFDYNMDHVIRIIDNELRQSGQNRISGRSTIPSVDRWDGLKNGRAVAPGVYYFRIKPKKGNAKFGKIIVARN